MSTAEDLALFQEVDLGDIIGATGRVGTTRKGELSVFVAALGDADEGPAPACPRSGRACRIPTCSNVAATCT